MHLYFWRETYNLTVQLNRRIWFLAEKKKNTVTARDINLFEITVSITLWGDCNFLQFYSFNKCSYICCHLLPNKSGQSVMRWSGIWLMCWRTPLPPPPPPSPFARSLVHILTLPFRWLHTGAIRRHCFGIFPQEILAYRIKFHRARKHRRYLRRKHLRWTPGLIEFHRRKSQLRLESGWEGNL